ncbi:hypothetical protein GGU10DRAFT_434731 [Lentinula aff. detonsa]|uniref:Uncharacterized protein n=1 Tax=Lentinula aff. detonsa TaxID=2804958 RepID=A0AA38L5E0_9AGAR|nr:hypothetical protein GGU10DRAFT_434731 [Lentinula aff. detonsa]
MSVSDAARENTQIATSSGVQLARDADLLIRSYLSSSLALDQPYTGPPIPLPLCIPQASLNPNENSTFARGYNDAFTVIGIPQDVFLSFIDGLNMAIIASPPLRVVEFTGTVIAFIPHHWAKIAGALISTTAGIAIHVLSKTLTDRYLRAANLNLFKPRGLSVRICTTAAMLALLTSSESNARSKLDKFGRGVGSVLLRLPVPIVNPIASTIIHAISNKPPSISPSGREGEPINNPVLKRRVAMTEGIALPLNMDGLPPPSKPEGVMDTMASWSVKFNTATEKYSERSTERRRRAFESIKQAGLEPPWAPITTLSAGSPITSTPGFQPSSDVSRPHISSSSSSGFRKMTSKALNTVNDIRLQTEIRLERMEQQRNASFRSLGLERMLGPKKKTRMERKVADADLLECWGADKTLWVVVMASDKDEEIVDIAIAEDPADEERIDDESWRERMEIERDVMQLENIEEFQRRQEQRDLQEEEQKQEVKVDVHGDIAQEHEAIEESVGE